MLIAKKYMLFPALAITCATSFVSAAENIKQHEVSLMKYKGVLETLEAQMALLELGLQQAKTGKSAKTRRVTNFEIAPSDEENHNFLQNPPERTVLATAREVVDAGNAKEERKKEETQAVCDRFGIKDPKYRPLPRRRVTTGDLIAHAV